MVGFFDNFDTTFSAFSDSFFRILLNESEIAKETHDAGAALQQSMIQPRMLKLRESLYQFKVMSLKMGDICRTLVDTSVDCMKEAKDTGWWERVKTGFKVYLKVAVIVNTVAVMAIFGKRKVCSRNSVQSCLEVLCFKCLAT